jgi:hypothetical protein
MIGLRHGPDDAASAFRLVVAFLTFLGFIGVEGRPAGRALDRTKRRARGRNAFCKKKPAGCRRAEGLGRKRLSMKAQLQSC